MRRVFRATFLSALILLGASATAQETDPPASRPARGSLIEDRAARKLIEAGDARLDADETTKAVEIWQSVIERYPRSRFRFQAHMKLGDYFLERDRAYDRARTHFEGIASEENRDEEQRAVAILKMGICSYHVRNYGKCFQVMRRVIEEFPVSEQVNQAYYYIGLGHFKLGHYSRSIAALEKVGTTLSGDDKNVEKLQAGKRFFVRIEDADLAVLQPGELLLVQCESSSGDKEKVECYPVGRNVRLVLGSIPTRLGRPAPGNGKLEVSGKDQVTVTYTDQHTAEKEVDRKVLSQVTVIGKGHARITDGAYGESVRGVVLGKNVSMQITDADQDISDQADQLVAVVELYRQKTEQEIDDELAKAAAAADAASKEGAPPEAEDLVEAEDLESKIDPLKLIDRVEIKLAEVDIKPEFSTEQVGDGQPKEKTAPTSKDDGSAESVLDDAIGDLSTSGGETEPDNTIHSGVFRTAIALQKVPEVVAGDDSLQALPGDIVRLVYLDQRHLGDGVRQVKAEARCLEGNIGGVRVTKAVISDQELRLQTKLKTASALTNIGNRYKEFGLKENANKKYAQALEVCESDIVPEARKLGGRILEETYVQLWKVYFEMERLSLAAAMCERLQREFPNSGFVDDALLQLADLSRTAGEMNRAIGIYNRIVNMRTSQLRGDAQFGIASCYESMAEALEEDGPRKAQLMDRAFQEFKKVFDQFPESGRVGEAVAKMASHYYQQKDYARAIDTFEAVLADHPDAKYLDVILFNYGRCLYRMERRRDARQRFDQLIGDFPESPLAPDAKQISDALAKQGF